MNDLAQFLVKAKRNTYAAARGAVEPARPGAKDLKFEEGEFSYLDSYFGETSFIGQEVVRRTGRPVWSMNYCGRLLVPEPPPGFSDLLREALRSVPLDRPFRGPAGHERGAWRYRCSSDGDIGFFRGEESIFHGSGEIYRLYFHGGLIV